MEEDLLKQKTQRWIVSLSVLILVGKFLAYYLTNSVGILTDAMESIVNVTAGFISLFSLYVSSKPKDKSHPFGHGKVELISASIEGILIMVAGLLIIYEAIKRLYEPTLISKLDIGILIVALGGLFNYLMGGYSISIGRKHNSIALIAGGKHLQSDTYSTIGLVLGLTLLYFTKLSWIDSALALIFGSIIVITGVNILRKTVATLMDEADVQVLESMVKAISTHRKDDWIDIHNMKTIKYGSQLFVDCDLTLPWFYNINESHKACDELKALLTREFSGRVLVSIHSDPCDAKHCEHCKVKGCLYRIEAFREEHELTLTELTQTDEDRNE